MPHQRRSPAPTVWASAHWKASRLANRFLPVYGDVDFFGKQFRVTLRNCGVIDPESIDEYLAVRGYEAPAKVLHGHDARSEVIDAIDQVGPARPRRRRLPDRARSGDSPRSQKSDAKYLICNADEGDPGAFMDRSMLEGDPHTSSRA